MDSDFKTFTSKNDYKYLIADVILIILSITVILKNKQSKVAMIFIVVVIVYVLYDVSCTIYRYRMVKNKSLPDLEINCEKVVIYSGFPVRKTEIRFSEVESILVPKWDKLIEIKLKNNTKANINLSTYSEKDIKEIKNAFIEIQSTVILKNVDGKDNVKTYHNVNGKCYTK